MTFSRNVISSSSLVLFSQAPSCVLGHRLTISWLPLCFLLNSRPIASLQHRSHNQKNTAQYNESCSYKPHQRTHKIDSVGKRPPDLLSRVLLANDLGLISANHCVQASAAVSAPNEECGIVVCRSSLTKSAREISRSRTRLEGLHSHPALCLIALDFSPCGNP